MVSVVSRLQGWFESGKTSRTLTTFITAHLALWTVFSLVTRDNLDYWGDMVENVAWGQEWQLGYYKHPPFFAWVAAAWFKLFPEADWAYYLLSQVNVIIGFIAVYCLARLFLNERQSLLAVMLLEFIPFYTYLAVRFNADAILLSLWPLAALFFARAYENRRALPSFLFGVLAAFCVMSKYYSFSLLAALFLISVARQERKEYYSSVSPYISLTTFLAVLAPHVLWLVRHDFLPVFYATSYIVTSPLQVMKKAAAFTGAQILYLLPMVGATAIMVGQRALRHSSLPALGNSKRRAILGLTFFTFLLSVVVALVFQIRLKAIWGMPIWFFAGAAIAAHLGPDLSDKITPKARLAIFRLMALTAVLLPLIGFGMGRANNYYATFPRKEITELVAGLWRQHTNRPLRIVAGTKPYADSICFYNPDRPSLFIFFSHQLSPWISPERLRSEGLAIVCLKDDTFCRNQIETMFAGRAERRDVRLSARRSLFFNSDPLDFVIALVPPETQAGTGRPAQKSSLLR